MIRLEKVSFSYRSKNDDVKAVFRDLDLEVAEGSYVTLMGHNASGKTTLGRLIKGLISPSSGKIYYRDSDLTGRGLNGKIGYIFSNAENQIVSSIIEEDVAFGPENQGGASRFIEAAVHGAMKTVDIFSLKDGLTHQLSGGEQQKVLISGILAMKVECIIFDEAMAMLGPAERRAILGLLGRLNSEHGISIINITHSLDEALGSGRVIILSDGKIAFDGSPAELLCDPDDALYAVKVAEYVTKK